MKSPYGIQAGEKDPQHKVILTDILLCIMAVAGIAWVLWKIICI